MHPITVKLSVEDYGWLVRYSEKNDTTASQVMRRALRLFIVTTNNKKKAKEVPDNG